MIDLKSYTALGLDPVTYKYFTTRRWASFQVNQFGRQYHVDGITLTQSAHYLGRSLDETTAMVAAATLRLLLAE